MNVRRISAGILGIGLVAGILTACGDESPPAGTGAGSTQVSSLPRPASTSSTASATAVPAPASGAETGATATATVEVDQPVTLPPPPPTTTRADEGPHGLLGNIAIWTSADGNPLNGAAFDVQSCGDADDVGAVDMSGQSMIDVPVSVDCWVVSLTRTPESYGLDGPPQRTIQLDAQTNEINLSFRFVPL